MGLGAKLSIRVGNGVEPIELGKRTGVCPSSSLTKGLRVGTGHVSICDHHFVGLVARNLIRCGEAVFVISIFDALDQPFRESLLGDGLALDLSALGDKELGCAVLPEFTGVLQVLTECPMDTESA